MRTSPFASKILPKEFNQSILSFSVSVVTSKCGDHTNEKKMKKCSKTFFVLKFHLYLFMRVSTDTFEIFLFTAINNIHVTYFCVKPDIFVLWQFYFSIQQARRF